MNAKTVEIINTIETSLKEEIVECGDPSIKHDPVSYGVALGLKAALGIVQAVYKVEESQERHSMDTNKPAEKGMYERTCEHQIFNPVTKEILCNWFYEHLSEPYQIYCHFPDCNPKKCPLTNKEEIV